MRLSSLLPLTFISSTLAASWPYGPLVTAGRWIHNTKGENVTYVGVNWPGAADTMIPEGLQYASIEKILKDIKSLSTSQDPINSRWMLTV
jgi:hypothetical protein